MTSKLVNMLIFAVLLLGTANATEPTSIKGALVKQNGTDKGVQVEFWLANDTTNNNVVSNGTLHVIINHTKSVEIVDKTIDVKETDFETDTSTLRPTDGWFFDTGNIILDNKLPVDTSVDVYLTFTTLQGKVLTRHEKVAWEGD